MPPLSFAADACSTRGRLYHDIRGGRARGSRPMIFNSLTFLVFFGCVMALHYAPFFSWHQKKINLLIASYLFYAAWNPPFVILLWISTVVDWWAAQWMVRAKRERTRKAWMLTSGRGEPRDARLLQVRRVLAPEFRGDRRVAWDHLPSARLGHRSARRHQFLYICDPVLHARRLSPAFEARGKLPQLRAVRDLLPAFGRGSHHAPY